jgi:hypothetical protein
MKQLPFINMERIIKYTFTATIMFAAIFVSEYSAAPPLLQKQRGALIQRTNPRRGKYPQLTRPMA